MAAGADGNSVNQRGIDLMDPNVEGDEYSNFPDDLVIFPFGKAYVNDRGTYTCSDCHPDSWQYICTSISTNAATTAWPRCHALTAFLILWLYQHSYSNAITVDERNHNFINISDIAANAIPLSSLHNKNHTIILLSCC